ncbi:MAG: hypothetical protein QXQ31_08590, partial [Zestosphaera sp.]
DVDLETVNTVLRKLYGIKSVEDYFMLVGVVPLEIAYFDHSTMTVKLKKGTPEDVVVRVFLEEIANSVSLWYNPVKNVCVAIECAIFEELASTLSKRKQ